jgi:hypothetical protein
MGNLPPEYSAKGLVQLQRIHQVFNGMLILRQGILREVHKDITLCLTTRECSGSAMIEVGFWNDDRSDSIGLGDLYCIVR